MERRPRRIWSVEVASSPTAAAVATGAGTMAVWVPPPRHPLPRWTAVPMKASRWSWSRERSSMLKRPRWVRWRVRCLFSHRPSFLFIATLIWAVLFAAEFFQRCLQVSVARLWQGAYIICRNQKTYPGAASGVSLITFDLCLISWLMLKVKCVIFSFWEENNKTSDNI